MFGQAFAFSGQLNAIQVLLCNLFQHLTNPRQTVILSGSESVAAPGMSGL